MIGTLGNITFEVSDEQVLTFSELSFTHSASYSEHKRLGRSGLVEFMGLSAGTCSIKMTFDVALGIEPSEQLEGLERMLEEHEAASFVLDGQPVGTGYWVIESISESMEITGNSGKILRASASVTLKEYHEA